jgi:predicted TPR repeat methyltransferase
MDRGLGDSPNGKEVRDGQYKRGYWDYMGRFQESSRYSALIGYITLLRREGSMLDVGCGEGIRYELVRHLGCSSIGIDISKVMISRLQARQHDALAKLFTAEADECVQFAFDGSI